jgi:preprotein translocase subunit YajC
MIRKIFTFLSIIVILAIMLMFNFHIQKQNKLDMEELTQMVEKEIKETHAKN